MTNKTCTRCNTKKPATEFSKNNQQKDGLHCYCKTCVNTASAVWREAHPGQRKEYQTEWYVANRNAILAVKAKYRAENPGKVRACIAKCAAANPESRRIRKHNRQARKRENGGALSRGLSAKLFKLQRGKCACGCKQPLGDYYHLDHIMPLALGGSNTDDNIQLLRAKCNLQKSAKHPIDFMRSRGLLL